MTAREREMVTDFLHGAALLLAKAKLLEADAAGAEARTDEERARAEIMRKRAEVKLDLARSRWEPLPDDVLLSIRDVLDSSVVRCGGVWRDEKDKAAYIQARIESLDEEI
jgi:hypothetical protein